MSRKKPLIHRRFRETEQCFFRDVPERKFGRRDEMNNWRYVTIKQAAEFTGWSISYIYKRLKEGRLYSKKQNGKRFVRLNTFHIPNELLEKGGEFHE